MNNLKNKQMVDHHQHNDYERWQSIVKTRSGVDCTILITPDHVSIRASSYPDFIVARAIVKQMTGLPIIDATGAEFAWRDGM